MISCGTIVMELLLLHLDNKGVLLWRDEPVGVKTVHSDELLEGGSCVAVDAMPKVASQKKWQNSEKSPGSQTLGCFARLGAS